MVNEINAEFLLTQLYPELNDAWVARHKGTFFRNYSSDVMATYPDEQLAELSRDGLLKLLPAAFLSDEDELKGKDGAAGYKRVKERLHTLEEAFLPVDTVRFQQTMTVERATQPILEMKQAYILKEYFGFDIEHETNAYVIQAATLLPYVNVLRGDIRLVESLLRIITRREVRMRIRDYSHDDTTLYSIPQVIYTLSADNLSVEDYIAFVAEVSPLMEFLADHFLPFDIKATLEVRGSNEEETVLDYNSTLRD